MVKTKSVIFPLTLSALGCVIRGGKRASDPVAARKMLFLVRPDPDVIKVVFHCHNGGDYDEHHVGSQDSLRAKGG